MLGRPFMLWVIAFLMTTDFQLPIAPELLHWLVEVFEHWAASLVNEKANKRLKETVLRESPSQLIRSVRLWMELTQCGLIEEELRDPITAETSAPPPPQEYFEKLFKPTVTDTTSQKLTSTQRVEDQERKKWRAEIDKVRTTPFNTFNPGSQPELYAEQILFRICDQNDTWLKIHDAWKSALLPEGYLVREKAKDLMYVVELALKSAVVLWPCKSVEPGLYTKDLTIKGLDWSCIFDLDEWEILPTRYASPLRLFSQDLQIMMMEG